MKYYVNIHYCKKYRIIDFTQIKQVKINTSFRKNINSKNIPEHLTLLLNFQRLKIPVAPRIFSVWDFVVKIFVRKAMLIIRYQPLGVSIYVINEK